VAEEIITLWRYRDLPEALVAKSKLDSEDLWCFLADENIVHLNWFLSNLVGGVRLQVIDDDAQVALELLGEDIPATFSAEEVGEEYQQPVCPKCGSLDVGFETLDHGVALLALYVCALPLPFPRYSWKCEDCGIRWRNTEDDKF
jgi:hypothetical protein